MQILPDPDHVLSVVSYQFSAMYYARLQWSRNFNGINGINGDNFNLNGSGMVQLQFQSFNCQ